MLVVYRDPAGNAASDEFQATVQASLERVADDPAVTKIQTYASTGAPALLSKDGTHTMAAVYLDKGIEEAVTDAGRLAEAVERPDGVNVWVTGIPQVYHEFNAKIEEDLFQAEAISLPIAVLILLAVFGTVVGAVLPLVIAGMALSTAFAGISLLAGVTEMSIFVTNIATMIGLALAIDYSLFMVSRFREELRHHDVEIALERMMGSVGKAVAVSGDRLASALLAVVFDARRFGAWGRRDPHRPVRPGLRADGGRSLPCSPRVNRLRSHCRASCSCRDDSDAPPRQGRGVGPGSGALMRGVMVALPVLAVRSSLAHVPGIQL